MPSVPASSAPFPWPCHPARAGAAGDRPHPLAPRVEQEVPATATAWTRDGVEVSWEVTIGSGLRSDWIPAVDVRRSLTEVSPVNVPPHTHAGQPRKRW